MYIYFHILNIIHFLSNGFLYRWGSSVQHGKAFRFIH